MGVSTPDKTAYTVLCAFLVFAGLLVIMVCRNPQAKQENTKNPVVEPQIAIPPQPKRIIPQPERIIPQKEAVEEKTKEKRPVPKRRSFGSSGKTFMEIEGMGCENNVLSFMSDTTLEICQLVCTSDPECGAFVLSENNDCNTYDTCKRVIKNKKATLFTREK